MRVVKTLYRNCTLAREWSSTIASINRTLDNTDGLVSCVDHAATADVDSNVLIACTSEDDVSVVELVHGIMPVTSSANSTTDGSCGTRTIAEEAVVDQATTVKAGSRRSSAPDVWIANACISCCNATACSWVATATAGV